jgi:hypothetical protein
MKHSNTRPEKLREHAEGQSGFNNINRKCQIQILVVAVPACKASTQGTDGIKEPEHVHAQRGAPTKTRFEMAQTIRCIVSMMGTLIHSTSSVNYRIITFWDSSTHHDCCVSGSDHRRSREVLHGLV